MALILNIETATSVCSVAIAENGKILSCKEDRSGNRHSEQITLFIDYVLKDAEKKIPELDAVAVSSGPGSYTGLRIGVSTAKGLCYAMDKPLISISTLQAMASGALMSSKEIDAKLCPMIDARRMEVYCAVYDEHLMELENVSAKIIDENSFAEWLQQGRIYFFGDGSEKCKPLLSKNKNAVFTDQFFPSASFMASLSEKKFQKKIFENVALFEPFYLKEFFSKHQ